MRPGDGRIQPDAGKPGAWRGEGTAWSRCRSVMAVALGIVLAPVVACAQPAPLPVQARFLTSGPVYVGQPVELEVVAVGGRRPPVVTVPPRSAVTLVPVGRTFRPIASSGIGETVAETNQYGLRFRVVAARAGTLEIPALGVESSGRHGVTAPLRREVRPVPAAGRPATFLGGVGRITPTAEAVPGSVRVGEPFEVRIRLEGPGALGSTAPVDRSRLERLAIRPEVEALPDDLTEMPPARVRRLRVRPTRAGSVVIPPWSVSWFDPASGRYQTATTGAVPVRVVDVPGMDLSRLEYGRTAAVGRNAWVAAVPAVGLLVALAVILRRVRRRPRPLDAAALARRLAARFAPDRDCDSPQAEAHRVMAALIEFLNQTQGRPTGALTPIEAWRAFETWGTPAADQAEALVDECDRALFSGEDRGAERLSVEARRFFGGLAERPRRLDPGRGEGAAATPSDRL